MSAQPMADRAFEGEAEVPPLLKVVEAASASSPNKVAKQKGERSALGSLKLDWVDQITYDTGMSDAAVRVGLVIEIHINEKEKVAWPKHITIAKKLGRDERSIGTSVRTLVRRRHLECTKRGSRNHNQYALLVNNLSVEDRDRAEADAISASKAASGKKKVEASSPPAESGKTMTAFERFMAVFPSREGGHKRELARSTYELNLSYDTTESEMLAGAEAYAKFCDAHGYTGTCAVYDVENWLNIGGWEAVDPRDVDPELQYGLLK